MQFAADMRQIGGLGADLPHVGKPDVGKRQRQGLGCLPVRSRPLILHRTINASEDPHQRLVVPAGHPGQSVDHAIDFQQQLPALLLHHLRHEGPVVVVNLLQVGLKGQGCPIMVKKSSKSPVAGGLFGIQGRQQSACIACFPVFE